MTEGSIPMRVVAFFEANPEEELTTRDIQTKFGLSYCPIKTLRYVVAQGYVRKVKQGTNNRHDPSVYGAGPTLLDKS